MDVDHGPRVGAVQGLGPHCEAGRGDAQLAVSRAQARGAVPDGVVRPPRVDHVDGRVGGLVEGPDLGRRPVVARGGDIGDGPAPLVPAQPPTRRRETLVQGPAVEDGVGRGVLPGAVVRVRRRQREEGDADVVGLAEAAAVGARVLQLL